MNITVDAETARQAQELFDELGLDLSTAINIFLKQCIREQGIPFHITAAISQTKYKNARQTHE